METLKLLQLEIMLLLAGACFILVILTLQTRTLSPKRRTIMALMQSVSGMLLVFDRLAYLYRGVPGSEAYWMVRISNFMVFAMTLYLVHSMNLFLGDMLRTDGGLEKMPRVMTVNELLFAAGILLLIVSQFTGFYYTFDSSNTYHRGEWFPVCYVIPYVVTLLQLSVILRYRDLLRPRIVQSLLLYGVIPLLASTVQIFVYGLSLTNISLVGMVVVIYIFALKDLNDTVEEAEKKEIEHYKEEQRRIQHLFEETAEALASAIDAKDRYTHGHSTRVADYSRRIAVSAGKPSEFCEEVYFAALLHDVGKIGVPDQIINKDGKLTDEEFAYIKKHPVIGNEILSTIAESPYLSTGAHYHHERYDGRGYPEGLSGDEIPELARIIGVADAYDAMTSKRSYRDPIPQKKVREELVKGMGTQFDPEFAKIMVHMIDLDTEYWMQEKSSNFSGVFRSRIECDGLRSECTEGLRLTDHMIRMSFNVRQNEGFDDAECIPAVIVFDSLDAEVHNDETGIEEELYYEYAQIGFDGKTVSECACKVEMREPAVTNDRAFRYEEKITNGRRYEVTGYKITDHAKLCLTGPDKSFDVTITLPENTRAVYFSLTGAHSVLGNINASQDKISVREDANLSAQLL